MKCTEREVSELVKELDKQNTGQVNYNEFLKFSYMCQMFIYHFKLESLLTSRDQNKNGLVSVANLDEILQTGDFNFPPNAIDTVLIEMLGVTNVDSIDRNCQIKIDTFMQSLRS